MAWNYGFFRRISIVELRKCIASRNLQNAYGTENKSLCTGRRQFSSAIRSAYIVAAIPKPKQQPRQPKRLPKKTTGSKQQKSILIFYQRKMDNSEARVTRIPQGTYVQELSQGQSLNSKGGFTENGRWEWRLDEEEMRDRYTRSGWKGLSSRQESLDTPRERYLISPYCLGCLLFLEERNLLQLFFCSKKNQILVSG